MDQFINNRYTQIAGLTLGLAILIWMILWIVFSVLKVPFPMELQIAVSLLVAVGVVWKFYAWRIG